jgi:hypothetical protein
MKNDTKDGACSMHRKCEFKFKFKFLVYDQENKRKLKSFICNDEMLVY